MYKLFFLLVFKISLAQENSKKWVFRDTFGHDYSLNNNTLHKEYKLEKWEYKNISLGNISSIDAKNPFKTLVVYKQFHTVIILDNFLNEINKIDFFSDYKSFMIDYVATAAGDKLWIKEKNIDSFYLFDTKTKQFTSLNRPFDDNIKSISSDLNHLYFLDNNNLLFKLNVFGNVSQMHQFENEIIDFKVYQEKIIYSLENEIFVYDNKDRSEKLVYQSKNKIDNFCINLNKIIIFANEKIEEIDLK